MTMTLNGVKDELASMLKERPHGTTALITEHTVIYCDGHSVAGVHLIADHPEFGVRFEIDEHFVGDAREHLMQWLDNPKFSSLPDLVAWLDDGMDKMMER
jgi:hypothetical protein